MANFGYICSQNNAAEDLNKEDYHRLMLITGKDITKPNTYHDGAGPVKTVDVLNIPKLFSDSKFSHPISFGVYHSHPEKNSAY